jgi:general secretion pathway protein G
LLKNSLSIFKHTKQSGFTLIEIMIVVVILGILASIVVPNIMESPNEARIVKAKQDIRTLESALNLYKLDNFNYPTTDQGLESLVTKPSGQPEAKNWKKKGYMKKLPKDPWGNEYLYLSPGPNGEIDIFSYGADGRNGGTDAASDIGNWML